MKLPEFLKSRKFWALAIGALMVAVRSYIPNFPLSDQQVQDLALLIVAFIIGTGFQEAADSIAVTASFYIAQRYELPVKRNGDEQPEEA